MQDCDTAVQREASLSDFLKDTRSKDWKVRARAALALRNIGAAATSTLIRMVLKDENGKVRELASASLGRICPATGIMPLVEALADGDQMVKERAADDYNKKLYGDEKRISYSSW